MLLRSELSKIGSATQISTALRSLQDRGLLQRIGPGVYVKPRVLEGTSATEVARRVFKRLGVSAEISESGAAVIADTKDARICRNLRIGDKSVTYVSSQRSVASGVAVQSDDRFGTPTSRYVHELAASSGVRYARTYGDEWAHHVTRLAGDDVQTDETEKLLVALKRAGQISGKEMVRLVITHLREKKQTEAMRVRPVPGF